MYGFKQTRFAAAITPSKDIQPRRQHDIGRCDIAKILDSQDFNHGEKSDGCLYAGATFQQRKDTARSGERSYLTQINLSGIKAASA